tara:strand:+ start:502 stop:915 length:414 start_codon:yes stop_codon:yes gene_type:complete
MRNSITIIFFIFFISCGERNNYIPDVFVNHEIDLNSPENISLSALGGSLIIENQGYKGLIIYRFSNYDYHAYDKSCTYEPLTSCAKIDSISSSLAICSCCNSVFLLDQDGSVANGPAILPLKRYSTFLEGNMLFISN